MLGPLDRRAFLRLATHGRERVLEISCERLHVRWVDARVSLGPVDLVQMSGDWSEFEGEPPTRFALETRAELLGQLDATLAAARVVRLLEPEWLSSPDLRREIEARLAVFRQRGGRIEASRSSSGPSGSRRALGVAILFLVGLVAPAAAQTSPVLPDEVLRARVVAAIESASDLPVDSLRVDVAGGIVTLSGSLLCDGCGGNATPGGTGTVQQSLGAIVRAVRGVTTVRFHLRYRPPA